ncbi:MAG: FtsX-like permease family protein [Acidobacteria bacterium]|nr:FtsX-like permease family protein [Acidobacteriota bacterium]
MLNLVLRNLTYYWRTNLAVLFGVGVAVAVLAGALLVGESVRASLRGLFLQRLGRASHVMSAPNFFRSDIPVESLHGRKDDVGSSARLTVRETLAAAELGEFSVRPRQTETRAVFVPLASLQRSLDRTGRVNTILFAARGGAAEEEAARAQTEKLNGLLRASATLEDLGVKLRWLDAGRGLALESESGMVGDALADAARASADKAGMKAAPVLSYLANTIRVGDRQVPYSIVTAFDEDTFGRLAPQSQAPGSVVDDRSLAPVVLNEWAARELGARVGDAVTLEYYLWEESGRLSTRAAEFRLAGVVPVEGAAADRDLVPEYPGITSSRSIADWDPPFPVDLSRIRPQDEDYWDEHRTTPKAFVTLARAQELWRTRFGSLTSLRVRRPEGETPESARAGVADVLGGTLEPSAAGLSVYAVRAEGLASSRGATDFGEYFLYFSFFIVVSALLLAALFFRLGVEQRLREIGLLHALGFTAGRVRSVFLAEALLLAALGSAVGVPGAYAYGWLLMKGLRTWWVGAVGTTALELHAGPWPFVFGVSGGVVAALLCIVWTLRGLRRASARSLLAGAREWETKAGEFSRRASIFSSRRLLVPAAALVATYRPGRSVLCITLIASAAFIIVAVDAFRRDDSAAARDRRSGGGGYALLAESLLPVVHDPNTPEGRDALNLGDEDALEGVTLARFRLRPGDDASCLNLYRPSRPRILAPTDAFRREGRFGFGSALAAEGEAKANPWLLLEREFEDGAVPFVADANSAAYVLHVGLGEDFILERGGGAAPLRLRLVATLADSVFQGELMVSERNFLRHFPEQEGYRVFLLDLPPNSDAADAQRVAAALEGRLADFGFDAVSTSERLASFHRVENTYLSTFQMLGGLGLALGTLGLAAVLLRNVLERRRELALLRAVGYRRADFGLMIVAENALLLAAGLLTGVLSALPAIAPVVAARGGRLPLASLGMLLAAVVVSGLAASLVATAAALRAPLLASLREE